MNVYCHNNTGMQMVKWNNLIRPNNSMISKDLHPLLVLGVKSALYHASLSLPIRKAAHRKFVRDEIQVLLN